MYINDIVFTIHNVLTVIVFGLPGSGKSYFAERLALRLGAAYLSSDRIRSEMFAVRRYTADEKQAVYDAMLDQALRLQHQDIVLDATFYTQAIRTLFANALDHHPVVFIEVRADQETTSRRLHKARAYSEADARVRRVISDEWEDMHDPHLVLQSTDNNIDDMMAVALQHLNRTT
jgi:predicted kinase